MGAVVTRLGAYLRLNDQPINGYRQNDILENGIKHYFSKKKKKKSKLRDQNENSTEV